jgi:glycerol-3-phosphate dehydrogenase (NAD(P)+)
VSERIAVLGAGSWGTTLALHLHPVAEAVRLWDVSTSHLADLSAQGENRKFLPGIPLPSGIKVQPELEKALEAATVVVFAVPSHGMRSVARRVAVANPDAMAVCASKGLETESLKRMTEVIDEEWPGRSPVLLAGPSHAEEVSRGIPTSVVAASRNPERARQVQTLFSTRRFRVYTNDDVIGCELGVALKNVIAIAAGVCDGLGYGDNTKGALLTRGLAEMARLGVAMGGRRETFFGLCGMGDLITTAMSRHSRNRHLGEALGKGFSLEQALGSMHMVAEGVNTARAARELGRRHATEMPITEQVCAVLFEGRPPEKAIEGLMSRDLKSE